MSASSEDVSEIVIELFRDLYDEDIEDAIEEFRNDEGDGDGAGGSDADTDTDTDDTTEDE